MMRIKNFAAKNWLCCLGLVLCVGAPAMSAANSVGISLTKARKVLTAAENEAIRTNTLMNIAIVDAGANLVAFVRMDGSFIGSIDIAIKKAKTARWFNMTTEALGKESKPTGTLYQIEHSNGGLVTFGGGVPICNQKGNVIGAIGVSGDSVANDIAVATVGVQSVTGTCP